MATYYVSAAGSNSNTGLSNAQAWLTPQYAESVLRNTSAAHKILLRCGDTFKLPAGGSIRHSVGGSSKSVMAEWGAYYMDGGTETEGVSGAKPRIKGDYGATMVAGASFVSGDFYAPPKGSTNKFWYKASGSGTFPSTFPAFPTTDGATVLIGGVSFTARQLTGAGGSEQYNYVPLFRRNSADTANFIKYKNLIISNSRSNGISFSNTTSPVGYFEIENVDIEDTADTGLWSGHYTSLNGEWVIDGLTLHHCGHGARDSNFNSTNGGVRPAAVRFSGKSNTTGLTRILRNFTFSGNWQEIMINTDQMIIEDGIVHAQYTGIYFISEFSSYSHDNLARRVMVVGTTDTWYHRGSGYSGYSFLFDNEQTGASPVENNTVMNCVSAYTRGLIYIGNRNVGPSSVFDNCKVVNCTAVDNSLAFSTVSSTGHTGGVIKNNAFINYTPGLLGYTGSALGGISCDYNYWENTTMAGNAAGANDVYGNTDGLADLYKQEGWQNILSYTEVNTAAFQPSSSSSLLGAGVAITGVTTDISGNTRANPPSIGAWEVAYNSPGGGDPGESDTPTIYQSDLSTTGYINSTGDDKLCPKPLNLIDGNLVLFHFHSSDGTDSSGTSQVNDVETSDGLDDFTLIGSSRYSGATGAPEASAWYRIADSDPANYEYDVLYSFHRAVTLRVSGFNPASPIGFYTEVDSATTGVSSIVVPGNTTSGDNSLIVILVTIRNNTTTGHSCADADGLLYSYADGAGVRLAYYKLKTSQGATGDFTVSWTGTSRAAALAYEIKAGTVVVDVTPPEWSAGPSHDPTDTEITSSGALTDDSGPIRVYGVVTHLKDAPPSTDQVIAGKDSNDITVLADSDTNVTSGVAFELDFTGISEPNVRVSIVAVDDEDNKQLSPVHSVVLMDAGAGTNRTDVTISSGASPNSALFGLTYSVGDVIIYPETTNEDNLPISIDGAGTITITRGGNTDPQTFEAYLWSPTTGQTQPITFQDPFYQATIGPFELNTGTWITSTTVYVVSALVDENGAWSVPIHSPENIIQSVADGVAIPVDLDSNGVGQLYVKYPGEYQGYVYNSDGSWRWVLGGNKIIGVTAE